MPVSSYPCPACGAPLSLGSEPASCPCDGEVGAFLRMLADAESAIADGPDGASWAADIPVPLMREAVVEFPEVAALLEADDSVAVRFAVVSDRPAVTEAEWDAAYPEQAVPADTENGPSWADVPDVV